MVDPVMVSSNNKPIFFTDLSGQNSIPMIPDSFISNHVKGSNTQSTKLKLTSDVSDRSWEVELDGQRFARGWKQFSVHHGVRNDDVLSFRHDGDMVFHVTPFGRSFSHQLLQFISSTSEDENEDDERNIFDDDVYDEDDNEHADAGDDDDEDSTSEEELYPNKTPSKKRPITETENSYLLRHCEIDLLNEDGKSWTLDLRHNKTTGQAYMCRGWTSFCQGNGIKAGSSCRFRFVQSGTKPVLQLCPTNTSTILTQGNSSKTRDVPGTKGDETDQSADCLETAQTNQNRTVAIEFKRHMLRTGQLRLPTLFSRENGINEAGGITIVNRDGVEWKLHLVSVKGRGQFYIKGFKDCFAANGIKKVGDSFTLDVIRGGTSPILKICSKMKEASLGGNQTTNRRQSRLIQATRAEEEMETRVQKKARVSAEGGSSRRTRASNKLSVGPSDLQNKKPFEPCSISDQVSKVRQSIVHTLTDVRKFRSELEVKEHNLETSLLEIDALGEKILGISKFFNVNQV
ncbi:putative B3 domain-containing protein REM4 [Hirschfeldia incana]|nr:putative B3 domain-containing protein REM4 [Hirschfeldia incana]